MTSLIDVSERFLWAGIYWDVNHGGAQFRSIFKTCSLMHLSLLTFLLNDEHYKKKVGSHSRLGGCLRLLSIVIVVYLIWEEPKIWQKNAGLCREVLTLLTIGSYVNLEIKLPAICMLKLGPKHLSSCRVLWTTWTCHGSSAAAPMALLWCLLLWVFLHLWAMWCRSGGDKDGPHFLGSSNSVFHVTHMKIRASIRYHSAGED